MLVCRVVCSFGGGVHWCRCAGFLSVLYWLVSSGGVSHAFCPLSCIVLVVSLANMALFRVLRGFLARFMVRMCVCMGLGFCVDCGVFVRVWS